MGLAAGLELWGVSMWHFVVQVYSGCLRMGLLVLAWQ